MTKYIGTPLRYGIVQHNLGTWDLTSVTLWLLREDGSRTLYVAAVDILTEDMIKVERHSTGTCASHYPLDKPENYLVIVTA